MVSLGALAVMLTIGITVPCLAQQLPPYPAKFETKTIPGGVLKVHNEMRNNGSVLQDVMLSVNGHLLRAYWATGSDFPSNPPVPPGVLVDGHSVIAAESTLPDIEAVLTGEGRTYVRVTESIDEDHFPYLWIVDVSQSKVAVTRRIQGCEPTKQFVSDGAYVVTCKVNGEHRTVTHEFKDGVLR